MSSIQVFTVHAARGLLGQAWGIRYKVLQSHTSPADPPARPGGGDRSQDLNPKPAARQFDTNQNWVP